jgi:hypothetical protein
MLAGLADRCPAFSLSYGDLETACRLLGELAEDTAVGKAS